MHFKRLLQLIVFCISLSCSTTAMTQGTTWTTQQQSETNSCNKENDSSVSRIWVNDQLTYIDDENKIISVDYATMRLYHFDKVNGQCTQYRLESQKSVSISAESDSRIVAANDLLLAEIQVSETTETKEISGYQCKKKTALLGAGLFRFKNFGPKVFNRFGQTLSEGTGSYWVSKDPAIWSHLQTLIEQRVKYFAAVPLLYRIDPLGLMGKLKGFPMESTEKNACQTVTVTLLEAPAGSNLKPELPPACQSTH